MMKYRRIKLKPITGAVFSFLLTLLIFILFLNIGLCFGVFTNRGIHSTLNETRYYENVYADMHIRVQELLQSAGMPIDIFDDVINQKRIYIGCNNYINNALKKEIPQVNTDKLIDELQASVDNYYEASGIMQTKDTSAAVQALIYEIEQVYNNGVQLKIVDSIIKLREQYSHLLKYLYPILIILIAIPVLCLLKLHRHKHRSLRYVNYAMLAASILLIIMSIGFNLNNLYEQLNIAPDYYHNFIISYSRLLIQACLYTGIFGLILSAVLINFTAYIKYQYYNK